MGVYEADVCFINKKKKDTYDCNAIMTDSM